MNEFDAMKSRIQELENQLQANTASALAATAQAAEAKKEADAAVKVAEQTTPVLRKLAMQLGRTNLFFNGWAEASTNFRAHSQVSGPSQSNPSSFPFPIQAQYNATEFRTGPPQARFELNSTSDLSNGYILRSKFEFDMLNSGSDGPNAGNVNESSSPMSPRTSMCIFRPTSSNLGRLA